MGLFRRSGTTQLLLAIDELTQQTLKAAGLAVGNVDANAPDSDRAEDPASDVSTPPGTRFWLLPPAGIFELRSLRLHGEMCLIKNDGRGAIAAGWTIWQRDGFHSHEAPRLLQDGFRWWKESTAYNRREGVCFLQDMFDTLLAEKPDSVPADIWSAAPSTIKPLIPYFAKLCWSGQELVEEATKAGLADIVSVYTPKVVAAMQATNPDLIPPGPYRWLNEHSPGH